MVYDRDTQLALPGGHFWNIAGGQRPVNNQTLIQNVFNVTALLVLTHLFKEANSVAAAPHRSGVGRDLSLRFEDIRSQACSSVEAGSGVILPWYFLFGTLLFGPQAVS